MAVLHSHCCIFDADADRCFCFLVCVQREGDHAGTPEIWLFCIPTAVSLMLMLIGLCVFSRFFCLCAEGGRSGTPEIWLFCIPTAVSLMLMLIGSFFCFICVQREGDQEHLRDGHLALSGLQVRGHAMFSHEGLSLETETLEYAWLIEAVIGTVSGKFTTPQVMHLLLLLFFLFFFLFLGKEDHGAYSHGAD